MLKIALIVLGILLFLAAFAVWAIATYLLPYAIIQPERRTVDRSPAVLGLAYEHFRFGVGDGIQLDVFYVPATTDTAKANLIMLHGVGSCKEVYLGWGRELTAIGYNLLLWDQRAHGKSGGEFLTYGHHEKHDVSLAIDWLDAKNPGLPTGIYGNSMGGAIAIQSMAHNPGLVFGLIESTFTDLPTVSNAYGRRMSGLPLPFWLSDYVLRRAAAIADFPAFEIRPVESAKQVRQPVLHIHGDVDSNINISHARALFAAYASADKTLYVVENGDHADLWNKGGAGYRDVLSGFLRRMPPGN
jgi:hypothetical protein